mmetsp:Transcript_12138/g.10765  ORF Transcript_12138/g.10765 Transcript_12138/m.10765 type:complete len:193 (+) Transcript_12138:415-993(+)
MQPNYNAGFAFELLNPKQGRVNANRLHNSLRSNLKLDLIEISIVEDIIQRLAYEREEELVLSDMAFFEPTKSDSSFATYRKNFANEQDESDYTWHRIYKEFWKALINTVKQRRIIQRIMNEQFPDAIDYMFNHNGFDLTEKFSREDLENFLNEQLNTEVDTDLIKCIMHALDRDQDNLVSYQEFLDSLYGAE